MKARLGHAREWKGTLSRLNGLCDDGQFLLLAVAALYKCWGLLRVTLWALDLLLLTAVIAVDVEEGWLAAIYAVDVEGLITAWACPVLSVDLRAATRAPYINRRFLSAEGTRDIFGHHQF